MNDNKTVQLRGHMNDNNYCISVIYAVVGVAHSYRCRYTHTRTLQLNPSWSISAELPK